MITQHDVAPGGGRDGVHPAHADRRRTSRHRLVARRRLLGAVVGAVVLIDQATKTWAENRPSLAVTPHHVLGPVSLVLTLNPGAPFGMAPGDLTVIVTIVALLMGGLCIFAVQAIRSTTVAVTVGIALFAGGASSNVAGRLLRHHNGAVIDFIDAARIGHHDYWPVFNIADAAIVLGSAVLLLVCLLPSAPPRYEAIGRRVVH